MNVSPKVSRTRQAGRGRDELHPLRGARVSLPGLSPLRGSGAVGYVCARSASARKDEAAASGFCERFHRSTPVEVVQSLDISSNGGASSRSPRSAPSGRHSQTRGRHVWAASSVAKIGHHLDAPSWCWIEHEELAVEVRPWTSSSLSCAVVSRHLHRAHDDVSGADSRCDSANPASAESRRSTGRSCSANLSTRGLAPCSLAMRDM